MESLENTLEYMMKSTIRHLKVFFPGASEDLGVPRKGQTCKDDAGSGMNDSSIMYRVHGDIADH